LRHSPRLAIAALPISAHEEETEWLIANPAPR